MFKNGFTQSNAVLPQRVTLHQSHKMIPNIILSQD